MNSKKNPDATVILILLAVLAVHFQLIFNDFHTDDWQVLDILRHGFNWHAFLSMENHYNFRPFSNIIIYLRRAIFDSIPALWYILNIALHLTAVFLIYLLAESRANKTIAIVAALSFGIYFQHFEAVLWLYGIVRLLAAIMLILTLIFYYRYKDFGTTSDLIISYICFALALFAVEDTLIFTLFFGFGLLVSRNRMRPAIKYGGLGYFLIALIYLILRFLAVNLANPSTEYFFVGTHILRNFYAYCIWTIIPQLNHPYLVNFVMKYLPGIIGLIPIINALAFIIFVMAAVIIVVRGNRLERGMIAFLILSLIMPSMVDSKVSTKLIYIPSIAVAIIFGSIFNRLWKMFSRSSRIVMVILFSAYLLAQSAAINATIGYYHTTQENVRRIVGEIGQLDVNWNDYEYLLLDNLPGRVRPGHALKYLLGINIRLILNNEETENLSPIKDEIEKLQQLHKRYIVIDFSSGKPVIVKEEPKSGADEKSGLIHGEEKPE